MIFHGKPSRERYFNPEIAKPHESNWLPWLRSSLGRRGIIASIPIFPEPYYPDFEKWKQTVSDTSSESLGVVGFSAGAEFALRWLSEDRTLELEKLVLVAPWRDESKKYGSFSDYELDTNLSSRVKSITVFNSLDDSPQIQANVGTIVTKLKRAELVQFDGYGHFMLGNNMTTEEFPELLAEVTDQL